MLTIHKYPLDLIDEQYVFMPTGADILSAQAQGDQLMLWAKVDTGLSHEARKIVIIGTGNPIETNLVRYVGTVQMPNRQLVWHVFEGNYFGRTTT